MKAGILVEDWKLPIFERHLRAAGFEFTNVGDCALNTIALTVMTEDLRKLRDVLVAANREARLVRGANNDNARIN